MLYTIETESQNDSCRRITKVINYVSKNFSADIKQTKAAELACMTPQSFSRYFRARTGVTFVSFVNRLRINKACHLLACSNMGIIDIAYECGYGNLSNFNRRFYDIKQKTPSEYRRNTESKFYKAS